MVKFSKCDFSCPDFLFRFPLLTSATGEVVSPLLFAAFGLPPPLVGQPLETPWDRNMHLRLLAQSLTATQPEVHSVCLQQVLDTVPIRVFL